MNAYMAAVLACAAATALTSLLAPDNERLRGYIKYISGLVSLSVAAAPLLSLLGSSPTLPEFEFSETGTADTEFEYKMNEAIIAETERILSEELKDAVIAEYDIADGEIAVDVALSREDIGSIDILSVTVELSHTAVWKDAAGIERLIKQRCGENTEVNIVYE